VQVARADCDTTSGGAAQPRGARIGRCECEPDRGVWPAFTPPDSLADRPLRGRRRTWQRWIRV